MEDAGAIVMERLDRLARISSEPDALTRFYLTPAHKEAALVVRSWMRQAGMTAEIDAAGNVVGRYRASRPGTPTLIIGSHIDSVRDAGRYDGTLGVMVGIQAVAALSARGERLPFNIDVVAFGDEEGVRFPVTLTGSRALTGAVTPDILEVRDENEVSLHDALVTFGCQPSGIRALARRRADTLGYLEVHIEQGPVLEVEGLPVGVVTAINGASRYLVEITGRAGHAGTVPMRLRQDALMAAAEMALVAERIAVASPDLVATVGRLDLRPAAVNVIPARALFTLDIRSPDDAVRHEAVRQCEQEFAAIAARRSLGYGLSCTYDEPSAQCAPQFIEAFATAVAEVGVRPLTLASGAGHDGLAMVALCPIGMLFVRCAGGISHNPAESIDTADVDVAVRVLVRCLRDLGEKQQS